MSMDERERRDVLLRALGVTLGVIFLISGFAKLGGAPSQERLFEAFGFPAWALLVVGAAEVLFASLTLVPRTRPYGAMGLAVVMAGAVLTRAFTGVALPMMLLDAVLFTAAVWVVREQRPPFLEVHWDDGRPRGA